MLVPFDLAWGYIDPATTTYIIQIAAAIVVTLGVSLGIFVYKFQMILANIRASLHGFFRRFSNQKSGSTSGEDGHTNEKGFVVLDEKEALEQGIIDYPIPARDNYPALTFASANMNDAEDSRASANASSDGKKSKQSFGSWLWGDDRGFKSRALTAALVAAAVSFTFIVFSMLDSVIANETKMSFSFAEVAIPVLLLGLAVFVVLWLILLVLRGRVFDFAICLMLSGLICGYLQITFFNSSIGQLLGSPLTWEELGVSGVIINLIMWIAVFVIVFLLGFIHREKVRRLFTKVSRYVPGLLIAVQVVALLVVLPPAENWNANQAGNTKLTLTAEGIYDVSAKENVLVFVLDTLDEEFIDGVVAEDPQFFDRLDGFTRFTNNMSIYNGTFPSVANYLTGVPYDPNATNIQYMERAYDQGIFVDDIIDEGFSSNLYMDKGFAYADERQLVGRAGNVAATDYSLNEITALKRLTRLTALKSVPLAFKAPFALGSDAFMLMDDPSSENDGPAPFKSSNYEFYNNLKKQKLKAIESPRHFMYLHLDGTHVPWHMNEQVEYVEEGVTPVESTRGCFRIMDEYFKQMKELGIYKDATIIITGDHPIHLIDKAPEKPMMVGLFIKPAGEEGTPLRYNNAPVAADSLGATCIKAAGGEPGRWGRTYFDIPENDPVERHYYNRFTDDATRIHYMADFRVKGDAHYWSNWNLDELEVCDDKYWF